MATQPTGPMRPKPTLQSDSIPSVEHRPGAKSAPRPEAADTRRDTQRSLASWGRRALIAWALIGAAILIYFTGIVLNVLAIPVGIIVWTVVLVFLLGWQVDALERRGIKRIWATVAAYAGLILAIAAIGFLMFSPFFNIGDQFQNLINGLPGYIERLVTSLNEFSQRIAAMMNNPSVSGIVESAQKSLIEAASGIAGSSISNIIDIGQLTMNTLLCIGFAVVVSFWIILELPHLLKEVFRLVPERYHDDALFFHKTMSAALGGYVKATILQCGIIALGCIIAFSILGVPDAMAIGIIAGFLNVIPVVGPWLGGAVAAFAALLESPIIAMLALVAAIVIQQVVYTFISPKLMAQSVDVHPALVIIALMIGYAVGMQMSGMVGALVGMLLSIPLAAIGKAVFVYYFEKRTGRHLVSPDGVFFKGTPSGSVPDPARDAVSPNPAWTGRMQPIGAPSAQQARRPAGDGRTVRLDGATAPTQRLGGTGTTARPEAGQVPRPEAGRQARRQPAHSGQQASNRKKGQPPQD